MKNPFRLISSPLSPNTQPDDVKLAFWLLFRPGLWQKSSNSKETGSYGANANPMSGDAIWRLEETFQNYLGVKHAYSFNSGRSALMAVLHGLGLQNGSEVLLQAFTCNAAANPIRWSGLVPVFVDCNESYNMSATDLKRKITPKSRAVMVQHTFGLPADIDEIKKICDENNLALIEDCAHSLGAKYHGQKVGTFGKAAFFSLSRDKVISCVYGGMAVTNDEELAKKILNYQDELRLPGKPSDFPATAAPGVDELADPARFTRSAASTDVIFAKNPYPFQGDPLEREKGLAAGLLPQEIVVRAGDVGIEPI